MSATTKPTELAVPTTAEGVRDLLKRAAKGDIATLPAIRKLLENQANIDAFGGNLARYAQGHLVGALSGEDLSVREAIHAKLAAMKKELLGENPTPVERLLVERVVACWLSVQDAEIRTASQREMTLKQGDFHQRAWMPRTSVTSPPSGGAGTRPETRHPSPPDQSRPETGEHRCSRRSHRHGRLKDVIPASGEELVNLVRRRGRCARPGSNSSRVDVPRWISRCIGQHHCYHSQAR